MGSGLYAHPGVLLEEHANGALSLVRVAAADAPLWHDALWRTSLELAVALHDFGKATAYFQDALNEKRVKDRYSQHAYLSALFFLHKALHIFGDACERVEVVLFPYVAIKRHHTDLCDIYAELSAPQEEELALLEVQVRSIPPSAANAFLQALDLPASTKNNLSFDPDAFLDWLRNGAQNVFSRWRCWWRKTSDARVFSDFYKFLTVYSLLLDADKMEAGTKGMVPERRHLPPEIVTLYKTQKIRAQNPLDQLRDQAYSEVLAQQYSADQHFYTITLPTGLGKTLTGLAAALKLRDTIRRAKNYTPRLIYALPFLSIIDQNASVLEDVLRTTLKDAESAVLLKHHHLAELRYRRGHGEAYQEFDFATSRLLVEGWYSEIVITTFVQLFNTLLAWRNGAARRVHQLQGAILLLDEVQAIPSVFWPIFRELFTFLGEEMGVYIILMTATQPYLLPCARELVPDPQRYYASLDRYSVLCDQDPLLLEAFAEEVTIPRGRTCLFVANTIGSAQQLYDLLKPRLEGPGTFLSSGVVPKERLQRIERMRQGHYRFAVSTQLIEAGVDVNFNLIYRDFAPLDALVQTAGRCNRHGTADCPGLVRVMRWIDPQRRDFAHRIYDYVLLECTRKCLSERSSFSEPEFVGLMNTYFQQVWERGIPDAISKNLYKAIQELRFHAPQSLSCITQPTEAEGARISQFCLIPAEPYRKDVFVEVDEEARALRQRAKECLEKARKGRSLRWAQECLASIKARFLQHVISVPLKEDMGLEWDEDLAMYVIPHTRTLEFYHPEKGFIVYP
ncbi:MAG: CRISPR-associated helicase Cas3' [Candidatus Bipolaricaulota bacterium]|nr:CRISPR-associated helicase Cas3' [Candidatus Bipolaricaulota bacterium]MDW8127341.1 CRISPR-associated helicase Cas3' [Candidatus Bipolaricaulota bacterium]